MTNVRENRAAAQKMSKSGFSLNDKKSKSSLIDCQAKTRFPGRLWQKKHSEVEWGCRVSKRRNLLCSSRRRTTSTRSTISAWSIIGFQGSTFDTISRRKLAEDRDLVLELTVKIQELQNEINHVNYSRESQGAEQLRSGPLQLFIRKSPILASLMYQNTHHHMWWVKAKHQFRIWDASPDRQPKILSSLVRETLQKIKGQTNNDCRFRILILTNSLHQQRSLVGR